MTFSDLKKYSLPDSSGVYFWLNHGKILYIGRATSLSDRIKSYFSNDLIVSRGPRIVDMVSKSEEISWRETESVLEAIILEANLIKKHQPPYNVKEKDDKSWNYVVITKESFPRILIVRGRELENKNLKISKTFGPFPKGTLLRDALKIIRKIFPFIDRSSIQKDKYHFYRQLGLTPDTASDKAIFEYKKTIRHIVLFFQGKKKELLKNLEREMKSYAKNREFEKASLVKKKIFALNHIKDISLIKSDEEVGDFSPSSTDFRIEAYDVAHISGTDSVGVMTVVENREISKGQYRKFKLSENIGNDDVASLREILERRFKHREWSMPNLIVVDGGLNQINSAKKFLVGSSLSIPVVSVVKDERHKAREFLGDESLVTKHKKEIVLANSEAHRFAISYHRKLRSKRIK